MFAQDPFHALLALESKQGMMHKHK